MDYRSNITLAEAAQSLGGARHILITTHAKPDGDAFGSVAALKAALALYRPNTKVDAWLMGPILAGFRSLRGYPLVREYQAGANVGDPDLVVVLDTGAWGQVAPMRAVIEPRLDRTLILDHHLSGDIPSKRMYIDTTAAACASIVAELLDVMTAVPPSQVRPDGEDANPLLRDAVVSESLFAGIASDTGWFRFSNTTAATHILAARLIRAGVDQSDLYAMLEQSDRPQRLALQRRALENLRLLADDRVAIITIRARDFTETGTLLEETEKLIDIPRSVECVKLVVLITEPPAPPAEPGAKPGAKRPAIRVSFRSKPGEGAINVADFAAQFGGGGHARASGAKIDGALEDVVKKIEQAVMKIMR